MDNDANTNYTLATPCQWFQNCLPHEDIREGNLDESAFAANLDEVAQGMASPEYASPERFFGKTYVTAGLRDMLNRVVRALNGEQTGNRIISLQTGFGGGKTHSLIALYHIARSGAALTNNPSCHSLLAEGLSPRFTQARVAVFTDNTNDVAQGRRTPEGFTLHTLWGELAYQLGGPQAYERIRLNDELRTAPTTQLMKPILEQAGTALILIDELANYCSKALGTRVGQGTLGDQTNSFVQTLTETVAQVPGCVLIVTLPASALEVSASQEGQRVLTALKNRLDRYGTSVKPVDDDEVYEVVRRRLFERIDNLSVIDSVALRYKQMLHKRKADLPAQCDSVEYMKKIKQAYPFHPELIDMFRLRWGSFSHFQRTRGVLRLLAAIVQDQWNRRESLAGSRMLIHTADVSLANIPTLTDMVTHLMGSAWESVMTADVYGASSNARLIDESYTAGNIANYALTRGVATTLLMASVVSRATNAGLSMRQLKLCMLRPDAFNHSDIDTAMNRLEAQAHYLHTTGIGEKTYHFESKANVNILLVQAKAGIASAAIDAEIVTRLKHAANYATGSMRVLVNPASDIPEQKSLALIILHPSMTVQSLQPVGDTEQTIATIATKRGNSDRIYRNTLLFLLCSESGKTALADKVGDFLATKRVLDEYNTRLDNDQRRDLLDKQKTYSEELDKHLAKAYCIAAKHSAKQGVLTTAINATANSLAAQITQNFTTHLKDEEWLIDSIGQSLLRENNLLPTPGSAPIRVKDLLEAFLRFDDKPMISSHEAVRKTVDRYCQEGLFNVAVGLDGNYTKVYAHESIPFLDVTQDDYWLVDTSVTLAPTPAPAPVSPVSSHQGTEETPTTPQPAPSIPSQNTPQPRTIRTLTIAGQVPVEHWTQLYTSFVSQLKSNRLKVEIQLTAHSTSTSPITDNSQLYASVKESAKQLGLTFTEE